MQNLRKIILILKKTEDDIQKIIEERNAGKADLPAIPKRDAEGNLID